MVLATLLALLGQGPSVQAQAEEEGEEEPAVNADRGSIDLGALAYARLTVNAPAECPDAQAFRDLVLARLGYVAFYDDASRSITVTMTVSEGGYVGHFSSEMPGTDRSERTIRATDCAQVAAALAVVAALALDPLGQNAERTAERPRRPLTEDLAALDAEAPPVFETQEESAIADESSPESTPFHFGMGLFVAGTVGMLPEPGIGVGLALVVRRDFFIVELAAGFDATPGEVGDAGSRLFAAVASGQLATCVQVSLAQGCATFRAGALIAESDERRGTSGTAFVGYLGLRLGVSGLLGGIEWSGSVWAEFPLARTEIRFGDRRVWRAPPVVGGIRLGATFNLI